MDKLAKTSVLKNILFICLLCGIILWMLRDIFPSFSTHIVGDGGDAPIFAWNLWWVKKALFDLKVSPLNSDYIFYPTGSSLIFHTLTLTNAFLYMIIGSFFSLTQSFNLIFLINFLLSGIFTYLVCRKIKLDYIGSLFAGLVFALAPNIVAQTIGHTNLYSVWFIPALLFLAILFTEKPSWLNSFGFSVILALSIYNDYYIASFSIILIGIYLVSYFVSNDRKLSKELFTYAILACAVSLLLVAPLLVEMKNAGNNLILPAISTEEYSLYSGDLAGLLVPSFLNRAGEAAYYKDKLHNLPGSEGVNYLGILPLILAGLSVILLFFKQELVKRRYIVFAIVGFGVFLLLSLGPKVFYLDKAFDLQIFNLGFLYGWLSHVPVLQNLRVPIRFVTPAMLCLAILSAYSITVINRVIGKIKIKIISMLLAILFAVGLFSMLISEYQTKLWVYDAQISPVYNVIASDKDDITVLELPFRQKTGRGWETGKGFSKQQLAQSIHEKKLFSGYISFASEDVKEVVANAPGLHYLANNLSEMNEQDQSSDLALKSFAKYRIRYIVLSKKEDSKGTWYKMDQETLMRADDYIKRVLFGEIVAEDEFNTIYKINRV